MAEALAETPSCWSPPACRWGSIDISPNLTRPPPAALSRNEATSSFPTDPRPRRQARIPPTATAKATNPRSIRLVDGFMDARMGVPTSEPF